MKSVVITLEEPVSNMKYIGPLMAQRLAADGIVTGMDLLLKLLTFENPQLDGLATRRVVRQWIRNILENPRARQCCLNSSRIVGGTARHYRARKVNNKAHNAILGFWRHYVPQGDPLRTWIPYPFRERSLATSYPLACRA